MQSGSSISPVRTTVPAGHAPSCSGGALRDRRPCQRRQIAGRLHPNRGLSGESGGASVLMDRQAQLFIVARSMLPILGGYDGRLIYGAVCYIIFMVSSLYVISFVGNVVVPKSIDVGGGGLATIEALIVNVILLALFAIQHSVMARQGFKRWWTQFVPRLVERSTYVLISSLILLLLYWQWRPMTDVIWSVGASCCSARS
jgi:hypothetical protein